MRGDSIESEGLGWRKGVECYDTMGQRRRVKGRNREKEDEVDD